jgi:hypothetical protein
MLSLGHSMVRPGVRRYWLVEVGVEKDCGASIAI